MGLEYIFFENWKKNLAPILEPLELKFLVTLSFWGIFIAPYFKRLLGSFYAPFSPPEFSFIVPPKNTPPSRTFWPLRLLFGTFDNESFFLPNYTPAPLCT